LLQPPTASSLMCANIFLSTLSICSSPNVNNQVSHPCKIACKNDSSEDFNLHIFGHKWQEKRFWTKAYLAVSLFHLFLISSCMQFWFVSVIPKICTLPHFWRMYLDDVIHTPTCINCIYIFAVFFFLGDYPASCLKFKPTLMTGQIVVPKRWFKF
jgi:hypothetical protein